MKISAFMFLLSMTLFLDAVPGPKRFGTKRTDCSPVVRGSHDSSHFRSVASYQQRVPVDLRCLTEQQRNVFYLVLMCMALHEAVQLGQETHRQVVVFPPSRL